MRAQLVRRDHPDGYYADLADALRALADAHGQVEATQSTSEA